MGQQRIAVLLHHLVDVFLTLFEHPLGFFDFQLFFDPLVYVGTQYFQAVLGGHIRREDRAHVVQVQFFVLHFGQNGVVLRKRIRKTLAGVGRQQDRYQ